MDVPLNIKVKIKELILECLYDATWAIIDLKFPPYFTV